MSQSIVQTGSIDKKAATNATSILTATASGNGIIVVGWAWASAGVTFAAGDITDNKSNSYALVGQGTSESGARCAIWCCATAIAGTTSPKLTRSTASDIAVFAYEISGQPSTNAAWIDAILAGGTATSTVSGTTGALTTGAGAGLVIAVVTWNFANTQSITSTGTSFTTGQTNTDNTNFQAGSGASRTASVASASITETWTAGGAGSYSTFIASFNDAAGGTNGTVASALTFGIEQPAPGGSVSAAASVGDPSTWAWGAADQLISSLVSSDGGLAWAAANTGREDVSAAASVLDPSTWGWENAGQESVSAGSIINASAADPSTWGAQFSVGLSPSAAAAIAAAIAWGWENTGQEGAIAGAIINASAGDPSTWGWSSAGIPALSASASVSPKAPFGVVLATSGGVSAAGILATAPHTSAAVAAGLELVSAGAAIASVPGFGLVLIQAETLQSTNILPAPTRVPFGQLFAGLEGYAIGSSAASKTFTVQTRSGFRLVVHTRLPLFTLPRQ